MSQELKPELQGYHCNQCGGYETVRNYVCVDCGQFYRKPTRAKQEEENK